MHEVIDELNLVKYLGELMGEKEWAICCAKYFHLRGVPENLLKKLKLNSKLEKRNK